MNKRQRFESRILKKQVKETGYSYKRIKRILSKAISSLNVKHAGRIWIN